MVGATSSISSMQWRGGSGTSSFAEVIRTSVPQIEHRKRIFTFRSSPGGGAAGIGRTSPPSIIRPNFQMTQKIKNAKPSLIRRPRSTGGPGYVPGGGRSARSREDLAGSLRAAR